MAARVLVMRVCLGEPRRIWCDGCLTSARLEFDLLNMTESGVSTLGTMSHCARCDGDVDRRLT